MYTHTYWRVLLPSIEVPEFGFYQVQVLPKPHGSLLGKLVVSSMTGCTLGTPARRAAAQVPAPA